MLKYEIFVSKKPVDGREIEELKGLPVIKPFQVHGSRVAFVGRKLSLPPKADALVTDSKKVWIGVLSADCLPVFLVGEGTVGVVHAGWRGTLKGVTYSTVKYISKFSPVKEAILGVCICKDCYEVGEDVKKLFSSEYEGCFKPIGNGKYLFDLREANRIQLKAAGVSVIREIEGCTVCNNDLYYSYRKERTEKRILSAIRMV